MEIKAVAPQGSTVCCVLYLLYTNDIHNPKYDTIATFVDDTTWKDHKDRKIQTCIIHIYAWTER